MNTLAFLLLIISFISLVVFSILWLVKAIIKSHYSKKKYAICTSASFLLIVFSIVLGVMTNDGERVPSKIASGTTKTEIDQLKILDSHKDDEQLDSAQEVNDSQKLQALPKEKDNKDEQKKEQVVTNKTTENTKSELSIQDRAKDAAYNIFKFGDDAIDETVQIVELDEADMSLSITVKGKDGWTDKSIGYGFYEDSISLYRELSNIESLQEVWISITFPMQDVYGNVEDEEVMGTWMSRETMNKVKWNTFKTENLLDVVDGKRIYPQFVQ
ncbi:hypothetical protein [Sporosarcina sp. ITBMC105]